MSGFREVGRRGGGGVGAEDFGLSKVKFSTTAPENTQEKLACSAGVFFEREICSRKCYVKDGGYNNITNTNKVSPTQNTQVRFHELLQSWTTQTENIFPPHKKKQNKTKKKTKNKFGKIARLLHLVEMESLPFHSILAKILGQRVQRRAKQRFFLVFRIYYKDH